jgi:hypothetical protein
VRAAPLFPGVLLSLLALGVHAEPRVVLSDGSGVASYALVDGAVRDKTVLVSPHEFSAVEWPSWSSERREIIFQGQRGRETVGIFVLPLSAVGSGAPPRRIADGRLPALSPDGRWLASVLGAHQLRVTDLVGVPHFTTDLPGTRFYRPLVWLGNTTLAFLGDDLELKALDIKTRSLRNLGAPKAVPVAFMHATNEILCVAYDGSELFAVDPTSGERRYIAGYLGRSIHSGVVWDDESRSLLFTRQTWPNLLRLRESTDLFRLNADGSEDRIQPNVALFGGFFSR